MNFKDLEELVSWMRRYGVLHVEHDGTVITLADVSDAWYPNHTSETDPGSGEPVEPSDEDLNIETPQERIRLNAKMAQLRERQGRGGRTA